ncbi:MAG: mercuric reductase [Thermoanaerobaculia bacterium]|nr:mercuric reductase [Thermoanaerobaculia bacterium]
MADEPMIYPMDEHNRELVHHVHPPDWTDPEPKSRYHLVVLGAGTAGLVTAAGAAGLGADVALVERHLMGGDCLNVGCVPSKGLIGASRVWHTVQSGSAYGAPPHVGRGDFSKAMERMRRIRAGIAPHDSAERFSELGVDVFLGEGRFVSEDAIEVGGQRLNFRKAVIATGARAAAPPIPGLDEVTYRTNETIFSLTELPRSLGVLGAGPIGCELAQTFARFGSRVTTFEMEDQVLPREDPAAAERVQEALRRDGVTLELGVQVREIRPGREAGETIVRFEGADGTTEVPVEELLVSVGRAPNVEALDLETAGVEYDEKGVKVDDRYRTTNSDVFACGDVASPYKFTHAADAMARAVIRNAFFFGRERSRDLVIPWCTYTDPEVAHVGKYPWELEEEGIEYETIEIDLADVDRALLDGEEDGFLKIQHPAGSDEILGATVVAAHAGDLLAELCLAITHGVGLSKIADTIHCYPTQAEAIKKAGDAYNRKRLTPKAKKLFSLWFKIFR